MTFAIPYMDIGKDALEDRMLAASWLAFKLSAGLLECMMRAGMPAIFGHF